MEDYYGCFDTLDTVGCLSMLVEVVTLRADGRREAEDTSVLQRLWCDFVNMARRWPTHRYINHRVHWSPDHGSFPEVIGQLGYHANPERSTIERGRRTSYVREHYSSNSSAYVTCQPTHMRSIRSTIHTIRYMPTDTYEIYQIYYTHKSSATVHWLVHGHVPTFP